MCPELMMPRSSSLSFRKVSDSSIRSVGHHLAPNAERVSVIGDFNGWNTRTHPMKLRPQAGVWELFVPGAGEGVCYKYHVASRFNGYQADKADPYGFAAEVRPRTASRVWDLSRYHAGRGPAAARRPG